MLTDAVDATNGLEEGVIAQRGLYKGNSTALRVSIEAGRIAVVCRHEGLRGRAAVIKARNRSGTKIRRHSSTNNDKIEGKGAEEHLDKP